MRNRIYGCTLIHQFQNAKLWYALDQLSWLLPLVESSDLLIPAICGIPIQDDQEDTSRGPGSSVITRCRSPRRLQHASAIRDLRAMPSGSILLVIRRLPQAAMGMSLDGVGLSSLHAGYLRHPYFHSQSSDLVFPSASLGAHLESLMAGQVFAGPC